MWDIIFAFPAAPRSPVYKYFYILNHGPGPELGIEGIKVNEHILCPVGAHGPLERKGERQVITIQG